MRVTLEYRNLKKMAFAYLAIPLLVFGIGYLRAFAAVIMSVGVLFALIYGTREANVKHERNHKVVISRTHLIILLAVMLLWTYLGGLNGCFFQSEDWQMRNAIFRDMITHEWPVTYNNGSALTYYIAFWMPPAALGRLTYLLLGNLDIAWAFANNVLWLWTAFGQFLISLLLIVYLDADSMYKQIVVISIFVFFSGLDIVGVAIRDAYSEYFASDYLHLEWWAGSRQFSSITTCLYWVFNQAVVPWLAVMCFLFEKDARNYLLIGSACLACGPFPFVGLVLCMVAQWAEQLVGSIKNKDWKMFLRNTFSSSNMIVLVTVIPVIVFFFVANIAFSEGVGTAETAFGLEAQSATLFESIANYITLPLLAFLGLEVGVYLIVLWWKHRKDVMFYAIAAMFVILPYFRIGHSADFCMRTTIPPIFILMIMIIQEVLDGISSFKTNGVKKRFALFGVVVILAVGAVTPAVEIYRGIYNVISNGTVMLAKDDYKTIDSQEVRYNFCASCYPDKPFYKYLSRHTDRILVDYEYGYDNPTRVELSVSRNGRTGAVIRIYNDYSVDQSGVLAFNISVPNTQTKVNSLFVEVDGNVTRFDLDSGTNRINMPIAIETADCVSIVIIPMLDDQLVDTVFTMENFCLLDENGNLLAGTAPYDWEFIEKNVVSREYI